MIELPSGRYSVVEEFGVLWPEDAPEKFRGLTSWYSSREVAEEFIGAFDQPQVLRSGATHPGFRGRLVHRWVATSSPSEVVDG